MPCRISDLSSPTATPVGWLEEYIVLLYTTHRSKPFTIFPTPQSVIRLVGAILLEQDDEWAVAERRYFSAESMKQLTTPTLPATAQEIFAAIA